MTARRARLVHSAELEQYSYPPDCPFSAARAGMARRIAASTGLLAGPEPVEVAPRSAEREELERFHAPAYLDLLVAAQEGHLDVRGLEAGLGTPDCPVFHGMYDYAALACGASLRAAELLAAGEADVAFNPSGGYHHAHADRASGFCYLNDVVLACQRLADTGRRVLFVDVDVHHCDGVQEAFYDRPEVMSISLHQTGLTLFPGTGFVREVGAGAGLGASVNVPLPVGTYDEAYLRAFREIVPPLLGAFDPGFVVLELGVDGLAGDPLAGFRLTNNVHAEVVESLLGFGRPLLATGGGGYNPARTARAWALCWSVMSGAAPPEEISAGLGGVMLESADWRGGLRDRPLAVSDSLRREIEPQVSSVIAAVKDSVFPLHRIPGDQTQGANSP